MVDGRCEGCRRGHYSLPVGLITNHPCEVEGCTCAFCWPASEPSPPTLEQMFDEIRELGSPIVACHPDLEPAVGAVLPPGFGLVLNPHLPLGEVYVLPTGVTIAPVPVIDRRMTDGEALRAQIIAVGQLEESAHRSIARFYPHAGT